MKTGDLVRFSRGNPGRGVNNEKKHIGLLVDYQSWEKIARVLYEGKVLVLRAEQVEKAGKKDG
jgi:hypothetical protein